jgi:uncharacterized protein YjiK
MNHASALNMLVAASPLLKTNMSTTLYTETLMMKEKSRKELMEKLLCSHFPTMPILLCLVPAEYGTQSTAVSTVHKILFDPATGSADKKEGHMHCRMAWKQAIPSSADLSDYQINFKAQDLTSILHQVHQLMFQNDVRKLLSSVNLKISKTTSPNYHQGSVASLLKYIKK